MLFNLELFKNKFLLKDYTFLTNIIDSYFILSLAIFINFFLYIKATNKIIKITTTLINLLIITSCIVMTSNEAFAYLFLITELSALVVLTPIILSKKDDNFNKNIKNCYYYLIFFFVYVYMLFFYSNDILKNFTFWKISMKENTIVFNDLYSLFLLLSLDYKIWMFFSTVFITMNMILINSVLFNNKTKSKFVPFSFLKKKIKNIFFESQKKYKSHYNNIYFKFQNWKEDYKKKNKI